MSKVKLAYALLAIILAICSCIVILLTSTWGAKFIVKQANLVKVLSAEYVSGTLVNQLTLKHLTVNLAAINLKADKINTALNSRCLLQAKLCLSHININQLQLNIAANKNPTKTAEQDHLTTNISMPFAMQLNNISIATTQIEQNKQRLLLDELSLNLQLKQQEIIISAAQVNKLALHLEEHNQVANVASAPIGLSDQEKLLSERLSTIYLPLNLQIKSLKIAQAELITADNHHQLNHIQLIGNWHESHLQLDTLSLDAPRYAKIQGQGNMNFSAPFAVDISLQSQITQNVFLPQLNHSQQQIKAQGELANLAIELTSKGKLTLSSKLQVNLLAKDMPFTLAANIQNLPLPEKISKQVSVKSITLAVDGTRQQQKIQLNSQIKSHVYPDAQLTLVAQHSNNSLIIKQLHLQDIVSDSQLTIVGKMAYLPKSTWQLSLHSTGVTLPAFEQYQSRLAGQLTTSGSWSNDHWQLALTNALLTGQVNQRPISIQGDIDINQAGILAASTLRITSQKSYITLKGKKDSQWQVAGQVKIRQLNHWLPKVTGEFDGDIWLSGAREQPELTLSGNIQAFNWQNISSPAIRLDANYKAIKHHNTQIKLQSKQLQQGKNRLTDFNLALTGNIDQQKLTGSWQGDSSGQWEIQGKWLAKQDLWQGTVATAKFSHKNSHWSADPAINLTVNPKKMQLAIEQHCWQGTGLALCLQQDELIGKSGKLDLSVKLQLAQLGEFFLPKKFAIASDLTGTLNASWADYKLTQAQADFTLSAGQLLLTNQAEQQQVMQWQKSQFTLHANAEKLTSQINLLNIHHQPLLVMNSQWFYQQDNISNSHIRITDFNLTPLQIFSPEISQLTGYLSADLTITASDKAPIIVGQVTVNQGELLLIKSPNQLKDISLTANFTGKQAQLQGQIKLEQQSAFIQGEMSWQPAFKLALQLNGQDLPLHFPPQLKATVSPELALSYSNKQLAISGNLAVTKGEINIEKLPAGSVKLSDDVIMVDYQGKPIIKEQKITLTSDINISIAKALTITGQGISSHLQGELQLKHKPQQALQVFGNITTLNGSYQAYGQALEIAQGEITFNGPLTSPHVNLTAIRKIKTEDINVGLKITGLADALSLQLFSTPTMRQAEILSYLVKGRGLDSQINNDSAALNMLIGFGLTNSTALFKQLEKLPFINNITLDAEGHGDDTQATISGYIGDRIYIKYGVGVYNSINELTVRLYLLNRLWLETVTSVEKTADLYYSVDIQ